jgi:hypothetical protein
MIPDGFEAFNSVIGGEFLRVVESVLDLQQDCTPLRYLSQHNERLTVLKANFASM